MTKKMTTTGLVRIPYVIYLQILLHHFTYPKRYSMPDNKYSSLSTINDGYAWLFRNGLLQTTPLSARYRQDSKDTNTYDVSKKGQALIDAILRVPLPVASWKMPVGW